MSQIAKFNDVYYDLFKLSVSDFYKLKSLLPTIEDTINFNSSNSLSCCPFCNNINIKKNGKTHNGTQKYICSSCNKYFNSFSNTLLSNSKKLIYKLPQLVHHIVLHSTIRVIAKSLNINIATAFVWRTKVLSILNKFDKHSILNDKVEADQVYYKINFKGTKTHKMPRASRKRGCGVNTNEMVGIETAIDSNKNLLMEVSGISSSTIKEVKQVYENRIDKKSLFISDGASPYKKFCVAYKIKSNVVPSKYHKSKEGYTINTINGIHSDFKTFMKRFRGVSIYHIKNYISLYRFKNYLSKEKIRSEEEYLLELIRSSRKTSLKYKDCIHHKPAVDIRKINFAFSYK